MTEPSLPEESLFAQALDLPSAAERGAFLDRACGADRALRASVEALLRAAERSGDLLDLPEGPAATASELSISERPGHIIGPYKLLEQIGEGGFGVVFLAEQTQPVRRKVALKVLKPGMDTRQVVARFEAERQALAIMDHPNIAKVHDGGATASGRPYFVMELVKGVPITEFCDRHRLTPRQRLELFLPVCQAVQHAHQKGIIHRDLKPSNVLVSRHDTTPVVKVIDFGVVKALGQELTEKTLFTGIGQLIGTPLYMSPEQAGMSDLDVDTRSDIYSLGVLLYELLTGTTPFDKERLRTAGYDEIRRIIREEEPARPSTRLSTADRLPTLAEDRGTEPAKLTRLVRGELDWIVMKCLEKDRNRRYETANGLALDIERYLHDEAVQACPPSAGYRLRKFARRHRGPVLAAGLVLLALVAGIVGTTLGLIHADQQRQIAEGARADEADQRALAITQRNAAEKARHRTREVLDFMTSTVTGDSMMTQQEIRAEQKQFLTEVLTYYQEFAGEQGEDELSRKRVAAAAYRVGFIEFRLDRTEEAVAAFGKARDGYAALAAEFPAVPLYRQELARSHNHLGALFKKLDKHPQAEEHHDQAIRLLAGLAAEYPRVPEYRQELARGYHGAGILLAAHGKPVEAANHYRKGLALLGQLAAEHPRESVYRQELARVYNSLGSLLNESGNNDQVEEHYRQALAIRQKLVAESPGVSAYRQELGISHHAMGVLLNDLKQHPQAEEHYRQALAIRQKLVDDFPVRANYRQELARTRENLGLVLHALAKDAEAEDECRKALEIRQKLADESPTRPAYRHDVASSHVNLGVILHARNKCAEAEEQYRKGLALLETLPPLRDYRQRLGWTHLNLANLLRDRDNLTGAEQHCRKALALQGKLVAESPHTSAYRRELARSHRCLGGLLNSLGKHAEAEEAFRKAAALQKD